MALENLVQDLNAREMAGDGVAVTVPPELVETVQVLVTFARGQESEPYDYGIVWENDQGQMRLYMQRYQDGWWHLFYQAEQVVKGKYLELNSTVWQLVLQWLSEHRRVKVVKAQWVPDLHNVYQDFDNSDDPDWEVRE
jgi:hypothetical protein